MTETVKILVDAGLTVILAITLLIAIYFMSRSLRELSAEKEHDGAATKMMAQSNLQLADAIDRFSKTAQQAAVLANAQKASIDHNAAVLAAQQNTLENVGEAFDLHNLVATRRDLDAVERDRVQAAAIDALTGKIQLVVQADNNELMLQIQVALGEFISRLTPNSIPVLSVKPLVADAPNDTPPDDDPPPDAPLSAETKPIVNDAAAEDAA